MRRAPVERAAFKSPCSGPSVSCMSTNDSKTRGATKPVGEKSIWLGSDDSPVFARLTTPITESALGGLLVSPPIGREARAARTALRTLSLNMASEGFSVLRIDHFGTSDSSGDLDDDRFFEKWTEQIGEGVAFLRSLGSVSVSAVGMRLGATILGRSAELLDLNLTSVVLWDPCESGRSYLRERATLEALHRPSDTLGASADVQNSEFVFREETKDRLRSLTLLEVEPTRLAERVLIIVRGDRVTSTKLSERFDADSVEWASTNEQSALMEVELPSATLPNLALTQIRDWIGIPPVAITPLLPTSHGVGAIVSGNAGPMSVREKSFSVGPKGLFAITSEPVGESNGPWIIFVNGMNEDHVGPSRLWVDLSRRWSSYGLRCVRFDFNGIGESPRIASNISPRDIDESNMEDICDVARGVSPQDPSNVVLLGLCSGAHQALEAALKLRARGVCTINPQVGRSISQNADRLVKSDRRFVQNVASRIRREIEKRRWIGQLVWQFSRFILPSAYAPRVRRRLASHGTDMLLIASPDGLMSFPRVPILRSLDKRRLISTASCRIEVVPGMDHDFLNSEGRAKAVAILDDHIMKTFTS